MKGLQYTDLSYYQKELQYLRDQGQKFSEAYPKIAARLNLSGQNSSDPHIERLIESFAFLTAHLQKDIDDQFPRLAQSILSILYPQLISFLPPMAITHFQVDPSKGKMTNGYVIPKGTGVYATSTQTEKCQFQTCYDTTLWPIMIENVEVVRADLIDNSSQLTRYPSFLKISLKTLSDSFEKLGLSSLRFFINTDTITSNLLYELLFLDEEYVFFSSDIASDLMRFPKNSLKAVGFEKNENVLPEHPQAHPAYRLLQEYFFLPEKFFFFDIQNIPYERAKETFDLFIPLSRSSSTLSHQLALQPNSLLLGCSPIINLFSRNTEPVLIDQKRVEYNLIGNIREEKNTEIYSVSEVIGSDPKKGNVYKFSPYFSFNYPDTQDNQTFYWFTRRVPTRVSNQKGTDIKISFVDLNLNIHTPTNNIVYAKTLCSNRGLASFINPNTPMHATSSLPTKSILCLNQPTQAVYPELGGATLWRLVSQLNLNYLSLSSDTLSLQTFQDVLRLYNAGHVDGNERLIHGIADMQCERVMRRFRPEAWRGFVMGTAINLTFRPILYETNTAALFSKVLSEFFSLYTHINTFTELSIQKEDQKGYWKTWPTIAGVKQPL